MVTVNPQKEQLVVLDEPSADSLREERRRTGRYVATVIAIFVFLFGLYQVMARGTPEYAAFFLPALIMFLYVLWILYASRSRKKDLAAMDTKKEEELQEITSHGENNSSQEDKDVKIDLTNIRIEEPATPSRTFCRTYSIA